MADAPALFELRANPAVMQFIPRPLATTVHDAAAHIAMLNERLAANESINWAIVRHDNPAQLIGTIGYVSLHPQHFRAEIGYMLHPACTGQGLMQEALAAALRYGFEVMQLHSVEAITDPANVASAQVLKRAGFVQEGHFKENEYWDGKFLDTVFYSLLTPSARGQA